MHKIAAFIEFDKKITDKILAQKKIVKKKFGNQTYLNHPVHLTLFTLNIKKITELKKIYFSDINHSKRKYNIYLTKTGIFYNDPLTGGHTFFYKIKKSKSLANLQLKHLDKINKKITVLKKKNNLLKLAVLKKNYKKYGFPFVGKIWIPHTTIASIKNIDTKNEFLTKFLKSKIKLKCQYEEIKFYKIINNKHKFLFSIKNI
tara:strand:- start:268 stop:873 length:606 start_codon:yes stop_codon:yes gene_type:complete